ncbi:DUF5684 domain-containing protein [Agromyces lapidis]|uniref:DUF5684 domain-containing protein n=1 Tax=Agromyces lapidis TaxID=279574 RepID=A0ABV5STS3_9MICO|nr:DUF5684 domain-containing protein [Agromyces lapidis]
MTPVDSQQLVAATFMTVGFSLLIGIGLYVWYAAMLAKVFVRFGQPAWSAWVPVYNEMQLFRIGRQQPWLALLMYVPLVQIVGLVFKVFALHRISTQSWRGVGTTVLGVLLPPVWATVLATGPSPDPELGRMPMRAPGTGEIPPVAPGVPGGPLAAAPAAVAPQPAPLIAPFVPAAPVAAPVAPQSAPPVATQPAAPAPPAHMSAAAQAWASPLNDAPATGAPTPTAAAVAAPAATPAASADAISSLFAPPSSQPPVAPAVDHGAVAPRIPGRIEPLPPIPQAPVAAPAAPSAPPAPPADAAPPQPGGAAAAYAALAAPLAAPAPPAPSIPAAEQAAAPRAAAFDGFEPADAPTIVTGEGDDDPFDRTIVVARRPLVRWRLVLEDGSVLELDAPVVVLGRNPRAALTGEQRLVVPDVSRTLSKTHAVLRLDGDEWSVTDLDSTNGVMVPDAAGVDRLIDPGVPTPVAGRLVLGTLPVALERDGQQEAPR